MSISVSRMIPRRLAKLILACSLLFLVGSTSFSIFNVSQAATVNPVVGVLFPPVSTFFQSANEEYIGNTATDIPYLAVDRLAINGTVEPGLANVPTPVSGTNDTQWIVNLISANMKWSDGFPINASDLAFTYGLYLPTGPYANLSIVDRWGGLRGTASSVSVVNSTAIKVTTSKPDPLFPLLTFLYTIYPWHYYKQFTGYNVLQTTSILSGPGDSAYVPANYTAGSYTMNLVANPYSPSWNGKTPTFKSITIQFFTSDSSQVNALAGGTVHAGIITPSDISALSSVSSVRVSQIPSDFQMFVYLHSTGYPWNNTAFRQAIMTLINRTQVNSVLYNNSAPLGNPAVLIPQAIPEYWPGPGTPLYNYSQNNANTLLRAAGLTQNAQGKWMLSNGTALTVTVEAPNNDPNYVRAAQLVANSLSSDGISATTKIVDYATADQDWTAASFQELIFPNNYAPSPYRWMRNPFNIPGWHNSTFSSVFAQALSNTNPTQSLQQVKQAELIMSQAAILNSIVITPQYVAYNTGFSNWQPALSEASQYSVFWDAVTAENVLTSIAPAGQVTSTSSHTSATTSSTTSTSNTLSNSQSVITSSTTTTSQSNSTILIAGIVVVVVVAALAYLALRRRSSGAGPPTQ